MRNKELEFTVIIISVAVLALVVAITIDDFVSASSLAGTVIEKSVSTQDCNGGNRELTCDTVTKYHVGIAPGGGSHPRSYEADKAIYEGLEIGKTYLFQVKPFKSRIENYEH